MSAIAGVYLLDGSLVDEKDLKRMNDSMPHRGPDGSGLWHDGPVGLAHQMLWTTPESLHETLPFEADGLVITSDSRIDNREEMLPELGLSEEVSDSEVILKAYGRWGRKCVDSLLGDFAFVIWDKAKEEMFCARDHMGVRPFYYYYMPGEIFAFATEIKALLAWGVPRRINEIAIGDYLIRIAEDKQITFYKDVIRLPSANFMMISLKSLCRKQYWWLDPKKETQMGSDEEYEEAFRNIFREAVKCRLRSAFPVGSMLSGGLDSSSIVCMARDLLPKDLSLRTFSIIFDTIKECDERKYIKTVLSGGNFDPYYIYGDKIGPLTDIDKMIWHEDQPFLGFNLFLSWALYREAQNQNVRVLLDGIDGDTTVSHGFAYITELAGKGKLVSFLKEVRGVSRNLSISPWRVLLQSGLYPFIPDSLRQIWRIIHGRKDSFETNFQLIDSDFIEKIGLVERRKKIRPPTSAKTANEDHWRGLTAGILDTMLEINNKGAAAFYIEQRSPFFDKRLVEFCLSIPPNQKIRNGWTRWILRSSLRGVIPEEIRNRGGKSDYSKNFSCCLLAFHKAAIDEVISNEQKILCNYVNISEFRRAYDRLISAEGKLPEDAMSIWLTIVLFLWLQDIDP